MGARLRCQVTVEECLTEIKHTQTLASEPQTSPEEEKTVKMAANAPLSQTCIVGSGHERQATSANFANGALA